MSGHKCKTACARYDAKQRKTAQEGSKKEERETEYQRGQEHSQDSVP